MMDEHGTLWSSGELGNAVLAIDPATDHVEKIDVGSTAHWVAVSHATGQVFVSVKQDWIAVVDLAQAQPSTASSCRRWSRALRSRPTAARSTLAQRRAPPNST